MADDGWSLVGKAGKVVQKNISDASLSTTDCIIDLVRKPQSIKQGSKNIEDKRKEILNDSSFIDSFKSNFDKIIEKLIDKKIEEKKIIKISCISYGIGSILQSLMPQYQMALLLILKEWLLEIEKISLHFEIYDPIFKNNEIKYLNENGFIVPEKNEECKRKIDEDENVLFYMPHCENFMYSNLIIANGGVNNIDNFKRICIIGNSFHHYDECTISKKKRTKIRSILEILPNTNEISLPSFIRAPNAFNNTYFLTFDY